MFPDLRSTIGLKLREYCKQSTLHGFCYFYRSSRLSVHVFWMVVIISSFTLCAFLSSMIWKKFVEEPTLTVVESTHYPVARIPFPSVAVCDSELVYGPKTQDIANLLRKRGYTIEQIEEFFRSISAVRDKAYTAPAYVPKIHYLLEDLGYPLKVLINMIKKPCEDLLVTCVWRSKVHDCGKMFRAVFTVNGFCCQFDMKYFRSQTKQMNITYVSGIEVGRALQVYVNGQVVSANGTVSQGLVWLYIFDNKDRLTVLDGPLILSAEAYYDIDVTVWAVDSSDYVKELPVDTRQCLLKNDKGEGADFYRGCLSKVVLKRVAEQCRCLPFNYTAAELKVAYTAPCNWHLYFCVYQSIENLIHKFHRWAPLSGCYERCDFVEYETEVRLIKENRKTSLTNPYYSNFAVHFADSTCIKYRRQVIYTWDQMWANLGGIYGLCLGGSIISIIEVLWFTVDLIITLAERFRRRKISPKGKITQTVFSTKVPEKFKTLKTKSAFMN